MSTLKLVPNLTSTPEPMVLKSWTVQDYHRMGELGVLAAGERTELIAWTNFTHGCERDSPRYRPATFG